MQGGTFPNDAVLRAFELVSGREAVRPDVAGLMGAFGAALLAREKAAATPPDREKRHARAGELKRPDHRRVHGALRAVPEQLPAHHHAVLGRSPLRLRQPVRARRQGADRCCDPGGRACPAPLPNLFAWKLARVSATSPGTRIGRRAASWASPGCSTSTRTTRSGSPCFTRLGFSVRLSPRSSRAVYEAGMETIPSESVCYPGKLVHGHVARLIEGGRPLHLLPLRPAQPAGGPRSAQPLQLPRS